MEKLFSVAIKVCNGSAPAEFRKICVKLDWKGPQRNYTNQLEGKKCIRKCPTLSIEEKSVEKGKTLMSCTKCGGCIDVCGQNAVSYHIKGTDVAVKPEIARSIYLYTAYIFTTAIGGGMIAGALLKFLKLATTGSMI